MRILLLTSFYPPEIRSISMMMRELAHGLSARGHGVTVVTQVPRENIPDEARNLEFPPVMREDTVTVVRIPTLTRRTSNYIRRGLAELTLPHAYQRAIRTYVSAPIDGVIAYIPHFPLAQVGAWVKQRYGARFLLNVQDIFPQNAIDAGIMRQPLLIKFYEALETRAYRHADAITTHTTGGEEFLVTRKRVPPAKISTVFNWIDVDAYGGRATGEFRARYGIPRDAMVFLFAGIFGPTQGLGALLALADRVRDLSVVRFCCVGEGTEKSRLEARARALGLPNISFHPFVAPAQYPALLADVDVGVCCLAPTNTTAVVPGKLTGYMAAGLPVLALLQAASEGNRIIRESCCGYAVPSDDYDAAERAARTLISASPEARRALGERGRAYAAAHFSRDACIDRLVALMTAH